MNSWEGGKSVLDSEIEGEKRNHKRYWSDEYEEELDQGKTKKVKKYHADYSFNSGYNPFQKHQDHRNYDNPRVSSTCSYSMWNNCVGKVEWNLFIMIHAIPIVVR